jgi:phosphate transport system permease protein
MIVLMATGNTPIMNWNIFEGMRTIAATIAVELSESEVGSSQYRLLFLAALILFIFTFLVNALAEWIRLRLREKYRAL